VNLAAVAVSFADRYPKQRYPAILLGSSNGALTHLAAAMQVPWLPDTVLVPVAHVGEIARIRRWSSVGLSHQHCWGAIPTSCCTTCTINCRTS
jgi:hypothetical protein